MVGGVEGSNPGADPRCWTILSIFSSIRNFCVSLLAEFCPSSVIAKILKMKNIPTRLCIAILSIMAIASCKKSGSASSGSSVLAGFWTYKEDPAQDYWNDNVLFKSDGTFRMYTALSLSDTAAGPAIADTASQVVTFGTYSVSGQTVKMNFTEFGSIGMTFSGSLNSSNNNLIGDIVISAPGSPSTHWYLTRP